MREPRAVLYLNGNLFILRPFIKSMKEGKKYPIRAQMQRTKNILNVIKRQFDS